MVNGDIGKQSRGSSGKRGQAHGLQNSPDIVLNFIPSFTLTDLIMPNNDANSQRTKHIDIHLHYTCDQVSAGIVKLLYIPMVENPADILQL